MERGYYACHLISLPFLPTFIVVHIMQDKTLKMSPDLLRFPASLQVQVTATAASFPPFYQLLCLFYASRSPRGWRSAGRTPAVNRSLRSRHPPCYSFPIIASHVMCLMFTLEVFQRGTAGSVSIFSPLLFRWSCSCALDRYG